MRLIVFMFLFLGINTIGYSNSTIDSFINANSCFFVKNGLPMERIEFFKLRYKDLYKDSTSIERAYKSHFWKNQCKIYVDEKSTYKEDIVSFENLQNTRCQKLNWVNRIFKKRKRIEVIRITPYFDGEYEYCYYVFHNGNSYMHVVFKLHKNKIVRFCYYLAIS